jgi:hypothetical protein
MMSLALLRDEAPLDLAGELLVFSTAPVGLCREMTKYIAHVHWHTFTLLSRPLLSMHATLESSEVLNLVRDKLKFNYDQ